MTITRRLRDAMAICAALFAPAAWSLDLMQAWQGAEQHAPDAALARAAREAGAARGEQAKALWRPSVMLEGGVSYANGETAVRGAQFSAPGFGSSTGVAFDTSVTGGTASRYALGLRQPVYSRERSARGESLSIAAEAAEHEWLQSRQALMLRTTELYFNAALAAERLQLLQRQQQAVDKAAAEARDRFSLGDRPATDVHEATARAATLEAERLSAETQLALAHNALADLTGLPVNTTPLPLPSAAPVDDISSLADWLARAERQNPGLKLAEASLRSTEARARASAAAFTPTVDLVAHVGGERLSGDGDFGSASSAARNSAVGVQLAIPLYTGGLQSAQATEDRALTDKAQAALDQARQSVAQQTRAAWLDLAVGKSRTTALAASLEASRARLDATRVGLKAGDRTTLDLLNAENDAAAAELSLVQARTQLITHRLKLAALAGELDDATVQQANALLQATRP
ncbi:MAG TPA: TolC family outer membrane protein [Rhizobacter sp.]|nr:TolC family outer membrane protein [Rhizobacter sp.]